MMSEFERRPKRKPLWLWLRVSRTLLVSEGPAR
jgi:hypothetical protein